MYSGLALFPSGSKAARLVECNSEAKSTNLCAATQYAIAPYELTMCRQSKGHDMRAVRLGPHGLPRRLAGVAVCFAICSGLVTWPARAVAQDVLRGAPYPVGWRSSNMSTRPRAAGLWT
jgi:hypothetical protein